MPDHSEAATAVQTCPSCGWGAATSDGYCLECAAPDDDWEACRWCGSDLDAGGFCTDQMCNDGCGR